MKLRVPTSVSTNPSRPIPYHVSTADKIEKTIVKTSKDFRKLSASFKTSNTESNKPPHQTISSQYKTDEMEELFEELPWLREQFEIEQEIIEQKVMAEGEYSKILRKIE